MTFFGHHWIVFALILMVGATAGLYVQQRESAWEEHAEYSNLLLSLKEHETSLDREILRITSFQVNQYEVLAKWSSSLQGLLKWLKQLSVTSNGPGSGALKKSIDEYAAHSTQKMALIERIKSAVELIRNDLLYLSALVNQHDQQAALLAQIFRYGLFPDEVQLESLEQQIATLQAAEDTPVPQQQELEAVRFRMQASLRNMQSLDRVEKELASGSSDKYFDMLYLAAEDYHKQDMPAFSRLGVLTLILVVALVVVVSYLLNRLQKERYVAEQSRKRLHDGLSNLSEAFAMFDSKGHQVLANRTWEKFYPWLRGSLHSSTSLAEIEKLSSPHIVRRTLSGEKLDAESRARLDNAYCVEKVDGKKWYLASDSRTDEGGLVCVRSDITESKRAEMEYRKMSRALEQSPAAVVITDTDGTIEYVNPRFEETSGYSAEESIGQNSTMLTSGDRTFEERETLWDTLKQGKVWRGAFYNKKKDGTIYWESASISPIRDDEGQITHYIEVKEDLTSRKQAEDQLRMNATVFETTTEGIMVTDAQGRIKAINPAFTNIMGYSSEEAVGQMPSLFSSGRHDKAFFAEMWDHLLEVGGWAGEIWNRRKDGSVFPEWLSIAAIRDEHGEINEYVALFSDITQRKQDQEQILYQANYDVLTGLPNRTLLFDRLLQSIVSARREGWKFALMFVDLDRFKAVNDLYGHVAGDELLQLVGSKLRSMIREVDTVARFGGDEFVVLLHGINHENDAALIAEKLIDSLSEPFKITDRMVSIGATIGITFFPTDATESDSLMDEANALLSNADMAMYHAKSDGRNRYQFFQEGMQTRVKDHLSLEQDLLSALENNELLLYYQPIHEAVSGELASVEALIRWQHPQRGLVSPTAFISLAEETGLIGPIGEWAFHEACKQVSEWRGEKIPGLGLSVNLSSRQRGLGFTAKKLSAILEHTGLPAESLTLEITENLLMEGSDKSVQWLTDFRKLGVRLAIDDFGTGYSSLSYLKRFPINALKVDRSFIHDLPGDQGDESLVAAIVAMADSLGIEVVAEGVENNAQRECIKRLGCDYMQGYLFGKPMPAEEILAGFASETSSGS
jgi:diguanylate cyclase (GGDEF)-like protein/PAS domain S-box-containing protein